MLLNKSRTKFVLVAGLLAALALFVFSQQAPATMASGQAVPDQYIIILADDVPAFGAANEMAQAHGLGLGHVYGKALNGFSARVPAGRLQALQNDPRVLSIEADRYVTINHCAERHPQHCDEPTPEPTPEPGGDQELPTGVSRIYGHLSSTAAGNGSGMVDVDVAVIDTGVSDHEDLNIAGGINCAKGRNYSDGNGHGTHVAGTIAALDNNLGVVGVAPGARIWAVRVLGNSGSGTWADIICGVDWVTANADTIEVANMSLGGTGTGGSCSSDALHQAVCNAVNAGVTFVVAAGNESDDSANHVPAAYDEVITVSALADFDGAPGGNGSATCRADQDDTFASFSNYGSDVDIIAPGVCINSTWNNGGYNTISGTSMAAPHVAGAAALYKASNPNASPNQVKSALQSAGNTGWDNSDDGDNSKERLLDVSGF
ncbi:MAG TPA: S8 family serine peptidase [Anaerolineae bacterium]|nr:S8 family serine peptidase [Anaerolineae bacterium]